jgi:hypothetical protein
MMARLKDVDGRVKHGHDAERELDFQTGILPEKLGWGRMAPEGA